jgi:hypothetical protein
LKIGLQQIKVSPQTYWKGTMVGRDARRFCDRHEELYGYLREMVMTSAAAEETDKNLFRDLQVATNLLNIVSPLIRSTRILELSERNALKDGCAKLGAQLRKLKRLTVKGHILEDHIPMLVDRYGTCGRFLEDGIEALHPLDHECRILQTPSEPKRCHHSVSVRTKDKKLTNNLVMFYFCVSLYVWVADHRSQS